jgi:hypothetical protein
VDKSHKGENYMPKLQPKASWTYDQQNKYSRELKELNDLHRVQLKETKDLRQAYKDWISSRKIHDFDQASVCMEMISFLQSSKEDSRKIIAAKAKALEPDDWEKTLPAWYTKCTYCGKEDNRPTTNYLVSNQFRHSNWCNSWLKREFQPKAFCESCIVIVRRDYPSGEEDKWVAVKEPSTLHTY